MIKKTWQRSVFEIINTLILISVVIVMVYPMLYIAFASFSDSARLMAHSGFLVKPLGFTTLAYEKAFEHPLIITSYINTLYIVVVGVIINVLLTALGAYFLSRRDVLFKQFVTVAIIFTMYFSGGLIPTYFNVRDLGLYNSTWVLILPVAINTFNLIIMRTGFEAVPHSLEESATLDGAGHFTILFRIILPLVLPTVAVMILYYGVQHWNSWFNASIYLNESSKYPLQLVLRGILISNDTQQMTTGVDAGSTLAISETIKYAIIVISTVPILCIYPFLQKYFIKGAMVGAVKE